MPAWPIWTVHCTPEERAEDCLWHAEDGDTKAEAEGKARRGGWLVGKRDEPNVCPRCRALTLGTETP